MMPLFQQIFFFLLFIKHPSSPTTYGASIKDGAALYLFSVKLVNPFPTLYQTLCLCLFWQKWKWAFKPTKLDRIDNMLLLCFLEKVSATQQKVKHGPRWWSEQEQFQSNSRKEVKGHVNFSAYACFYWILSDTCRECSSLAGISLMIWFLMVMEFQALA